MSSKNVRTWSLSLWLWFLPTIMMWSAITITFFIWPKHWFSLHWNKFPATVIPNSITVYLNIPSSALKVVRSEEVSSSSWCQYPLLQLKTIIMHASASRWAMSSGVYMIWFHHDSFVKVGLNQANPKLQVAWFILAFYKHNIIDPRCSFMDWFQHPCL